METSEFRHIVIVGASLAGVRAAQSLRKHGYENAITLVGDEKHLPYDRPPLSKQVLTGDWDPDRAMLIKPDEVEQLDLQFRLGVAATGLDVANRSLHLSDGESLSYDGLVIATGAKPRSLNIPTPRQGVLALRTMEDSLELREYLVRDNPHVVIVGAGFIGLEVASACRAAGATVTVVEVMPVPLSHILGTEIGEACVQWQRDHGVDVRCGVAVEAFHGADALEAVALSDGSVIRADVAVVGVGVEPSIHWLADSGLELDRGVVCDAYCFAAPGVVAAGDVARWHHEGLGRSVRIEHWTNAVEQAAHAAANLLKGPEAAEVYTPSPYFWSDQFKKRLQFVGVHDAADTIHLQERTPEGDFVALFAGGDQLKGVFAFGSPRLFMGLRRLVLSGGTLAEAKALVSP